MILTIEQIRVLSFPGVYVLYLAGEVVYVGMSSNLLKRFPNHLGEKEFDEVHLYPMVDKTLGYIGMIEEGLITLYRPRYNKRQPQETANAGMKSIIDCQLLPADVREAAKQKRAEWLPIMQKRFPQMYPTKRRISHRYKYEDHHGTSSTRASGRGSRSRLSRQSEG